MQALLDTNAFLWWVTNDPKLSATARTIIANPDNDIFFSIVSAWEIVIKAATRSRTAQNRRSPPICVRLRLGSFPYLNLPIRIFQTALLTISLRHYLLRWKMCYKSGSYQVTIMTPLTVY